jgi:hypothetical protein
MAISRVPGYSLISDLDRQGVDLQFTTSGTTLAYLDFANFRLGVNTTTPRTALDVVGNVRLGNLIISGNTISSDLNSLSLGSNANVKISGGVSNNVLYTDGSGNLNWGNIVALIGESQFDGNNIILGSNTAGQLVSNAVSMTVNTTVTNGIAQLNQILGKLVPSSPPNFPNTTTLTINSLTSYRMCNFTQTDNTANVRNVTGGATVSTVLRTTAYTSNTISNVGPGSSGTVTSYLNGTSAGSVTFTGSSNGTYGNLVITNNQDYHNVVANVTAGFWYSVSINSNGNAPAGWNDIIIGHSGVPATTNVAYWYYDSSAPGTPLFFTPNIYISSASLTYSSTIPHYNSSTTANIGFNVNRLSGDMFPTSNTFVTGTAAGAFVAPTSVIYSTAGVTYPLTRNLYVSSGNAVVYTSSTITTGFGSSSTGPSVSVSNSYNTGTQAFAPGNIVLYKTGTTTNIEETSIPVTSVGTGSGNAYRILNPGSTDTPVYTGSEAAFNSQTGTFYTYDATVVAAILKFDQTNYSTGYWPAGPNLSTQGANQYFTFKFVRTVVSKFDIVYSGTIAGLWVSLPGSTIDTTSTLNGWIDMSIAYAGAGVPGAGVGGNGSNGCSLGGVATLGSLVSAKAVTATFGTVSSSSTVTNEIYVRIKLTSGQLVTALSIAAATH